MSGSAKSEILRVFDKVSQGLRDKDAKAIVGQYVADAVVFDLAPPLAHRIDEGQLAAWLDTWDGPVNQALRDIEIAVDGEMAFAHGFMQVSARTKSGEDASWWMRATVCLARRGDAWKIVHEHTSVPFYMDGSFKAALDLSP